MDIITPIKKVIARVTKNDEMLDELEREEETRRLIEFWKKQFEADKQDKKEWDVRFDEWEGLYHGNREFKNIKNPSNVVGAEVRTIVNFPRMVIEALIDVNVPEPNFKAVSRDDEQAIEELKNYIFYVVRSANPSLEEINLQEERRVMKNGGGFIKVHWNNSVKKAGYVGDIELSNPHSKDIIPNKGSTGLADMEHYHHPVNRTEKYILRKWPHITKEDLENKAELYREYDQMMDTQRIAVGNSTDGEKESGLNKYTIIETTYRDEDGDICKLWWSGDLFIKHIPKFFYRRDENGEIMEVEQLEPGTSVRTGIDEAGQPVYSLIKIPTEVEYYIPKSWDIIYWPFIPRDKCFWGVSIMEDIFDLQESIKKAVFMQEESFLRGRKKIIVPDEELKKRISDPTSEFVVSRDVQNVKEIDLGGSIDGVVWIEKLKEWLQLITGSTNAVLGVHDPGVKSGKQAMAYIEQANFKVQLKSAYKVAAFKQLYRVIADFALAFCDNDRPFRLSGKRDEQIYGTYNRLNMIRDMGGNYIWPDWDIEMDSDMGIMRSRPQIFEAFVMLANNGRFEPTMGNLWFLKVVQKLGVPNLEEIIAEMEQMIQAQQSQGPATKPVSVTANFKDLPVEGQIQLAEKAGIQLDPESVIQNKMMQQSGGGQLQPGADIVSQLPPDMQEWFNSLPPEAQEQALAEIRQILGQGGGQNSS